MKGTAALRRQILARSARIAVLGQGYVGLSLACVAAEAGFPVTGIDIDEGRVDALRAGGTVAGVAQDVAGPPSRLAGSSSPATPPRSPQPAWFSSACPPRYTTARPTSRSSTVRQRASRRTSSPGPSWSSSPRPTQAPPTSECAPSSSGPAWLRVRTSSSRIRLSGSTPATPSSRSVKSLAWSAACTPDATGLAALFYEQLVDKVMPVSSCRAAELAKLLENTFRHVNIALVNEMAMVCHEVGIDVWEVIDAAATKPFGFMRFHPGPGVGGHCIPLDPAYLAWQVRRDAGHQFRILEEAEDINSQMPTWVANRIGELLNEHKKAVNGARVLVLGASYKPDVGDVRQSPSIRIMQALHKRGARMTFHDPYVDEVVLNGSKVRSIQLTTSAVEHADLVAVLTPHTTYDLHWVAEHAPLVFDATNAFGHDRWENVARL